MIAIVGLVWMAVGVTSFADAGNWNDKVLRDVTGRFRRRAMRTGTAVPLGLLTWL